MQPVGLIVECVVRTLEKAEPELSEKEAQAQRLEEEKKQRLEEAAARNTIALNPMVGIRSEEFWEATRSTVFRMLRQPVASAEVSLGFARKLAGIALGNGQTDRAEQFLREGLDRRPVEIEWHRAYQLIRDRSGGDADLLEEYDRRLAEAMLALRAIYDRKMRERQEFLDRYFVFGTEDVDPAEILPALARSSTTVPTAARASIQRYLIGRS
mgnify:CR=1 FL=1